MRLDRRLAECDTVGSRGNYLLPADKAAVSLTRERRHLDVKPEDADINRTLLKSVKL